MTNLRIDRVLDPLTHIDQLYVPDELPIGCPAVLHFQSMQE